MFEGFATHNINPLNSILLRNSKLLCFMALEATHNTLFHFIETVKVRG